MLESGADSIVVKANVSSGSIDLRQVLWGCMTPLISSLLPSSIVATTIKGGAGADNISLYGANDVVLNTSSGDSVFGGTGADTLLFTGSVLNSSIQAGSGSDSIVMAGTGMTGNTIDLGVGTDTIKFTETTDADTVTVTSTTISGAKTLTYEKQQRASRSLLLLVPTSLPSRKPSLLVLRSSPTLVLTHFSSSITRRSPKPILEPVLTLFTAQPSSATAQSVVHLEEIPS